MEISVFEDIQKISNIRGVIQVGSNTGQEIQLIRKFTNNIICFEPVLQAFQLLESQNPDLKCYNIGLGDKDELREMYIASNNSESSSFLKPLNHTIAFPHIEFTKSEAFEVRRFDSLTIDLTNYNILLSDTQGYEIKVLTGFGDLLKEFDIIYVEYINAEFYEGDSSLNELTNFLQNYNFKLYKTYEDVGTWGNAMYIK